MLTITVSTQRRFILGKQGLYPARRWQTVEQAILSGIPIQIDPLNVVARSHDITLYGRVADYQADHLNIVLYENRLGFDWGGTVYIHPMDELPYWRVIMDRKSQYQRRITFAEENPDTIDLVREEIRNRGALSARDFKQPEKKKYTTGFRSSKLTSQALYHLWLTGELMTHSRRGFERVYDLLERIAPPHLHHKATPDEADDYFILGMFRELNMIPAKSWRRLLTGTLDRKVAPNEAESRLNALLATETIVPVTLEHDPKHPRYILAEDLPILETLHNGSIPNEWELRDSATPAEMIFLAPLEIVSARGRAKPLFNFEYLWEVYKPEHKRRWGYYTLPILYGDRLVARLDPKLDRDTGTLMVKGFWLEDDVQVDDAFVNALAAGFRRFMAFIGADQVDLSTIDIAWLKDLLKP